jgi:nucleotide-binding universal stress UspA family protein
MRVLIAIDGSKASEVVLQEALDRRWPAGSTFCLITAVDPFFFARAPLLLSETKDATREFLKEGAKRFEQAGWEVTVEVVLGNPRRAIHAYAEEWRADLLLIGSQGLNVLARLALGSTVQSVLRHTKSSVEIVRRPQREGESVALGKKRILMATDGSIFSREALKSIAERPWAEGTEVKVISVPEFAIWLGEFPYFQPEQVGELNRSALEAAEEAVAEGREILSKTGLLVSTEVTVEREVPAKTILDEAKRWKADLIVVGSHGRRGFDRFAMGSVSESLAMNAHCSVEVVRARHGLEAEEKKGEIYESQRSHDVHAVHVP